MRTCLSPTTQSISLRTGVLYTFLPISSRGMLNRLHMRCPNTENIIRPEWGMTRSCKNCKCDAAFVPWHAGAYMIAWILSMGKDILGRNVARGRGCASISPTASPLALGGKLWVLVLTGGAGQTKSFQTNPEAVSEQRTRGGHSARDLLAYPWQVLGLDRRQALAQADSP